MTKKNHHKWELSQFDDFFNQLNASVIILNRQTQVTYMNTAAERLISTSLNLTRNKELKNFIRHDQGLLELAKEVLASGRSIKIHELEIVIGETPIKVQVELAPTGSQENPSGVIIWINELSLAYALQEEKRMLDRLSMMGTMASGLAHEIRNPLGGIRAAAEMLSRGALETEHREYASIIISEVDRLNNLIAELLDFSKPKKYRKTSVNLNKTLSQLLTLEEKSLAKQGIELKQGFDPSLPPVMGDEDSLKQALLNLIKNAVEAMKNGGTLFVGTSYLPNVSMLLGEGESGAMAQILIGDTGEGIPEENLNSLFTPFFTTKPDGTGLGLMITQKIIKEHQGAIKVNSEVGKGTVFKVFLKLATPAPRV